MSQTVAFSAGGKDHAIAQATAFARELLGDKEGSLILLDRAGAAIWEWTQ